MKISDLGAGILLFILAAAIAGAAWNLPNPAAQPLGPGAFPLLLAALLGFSALLLAARGLAVPRRGPMLRLDDWTQKRALVGRFLLVPITVLAYVLLVEHAGFLLTATTILLVLFLASSVPLVRAALLASAAALFIHTVFQFGLGVQLPWGVLEPIRW